MKLDWAGAARPGTSPSGGVVTSIGVGISGATGLGRAGGGAGPASAATGAPALTVRQLGPEPDRRSTACGRLKLGR